MSQDEELHAMDAHRGDPDGDGHHEHEPDHGDHGDHDGADDEHGDASPLADLPPTPVHGYWKSLRELDGKAAFQVGRTGHEFPPGASGTDRPLLDPLSRRTFVQLMGASMALAGAGACRRYEKE